MVLAALSHFPVGVGRDALAQPSPAAPLGELLTAISKDGTRIGFECTGAGPTLLFVHGGVGDHTRWMPMARLLAPKFTVCAMDRRGRGTSGDSPEFSLAKEAQDIVAVVESRPAPVVVLGHSYGGVAALEAAMLTTRISRLILYEAPLFEPAEESLSAAVTIEALLKKGQAEEALIVFQRDIVKQSTEELARMKTRPTWPELVATIGTQPRQLRALAAYRFDAARMKAVTIPTLLLLGEKTASPYVRQSIAALRDSLPHPTLVVLAGQHHNAMDAGRDILAKAILEFAAVP
jgi:pimeloyl-ACP methyl ester carboxylesterase